MIFLLQSESTEFNNDEFNEYKKDQCLNLLDNIFEIAMAGMEPVTFRLAADTLNSELLEHSFVFIY
jgi:hypothetical protein